MATRTRTAPNVDLTAADPKKVLDARNKLAWARHHVDAYNRQDSKTGASELYFYDSKGPKKRLTDEDLDNGLLIAAMGLSPDLKPIDQYAYNPTNTGWITLLSAEDVETLHQSAEAWYEAKVKNLETKAWLGQPDVDYDNWVVARDSAVNAAQAADRQLREIKGAQVEKVKLPKLLYLGAVLAGGLPALAIVIGVRVAVNAVEANKHRVEIAAAEGRKAQIEMTAENYAATVASMEQEKATSQAAMDEARRQFEVDLGFGDPERSIQVPPGMSGPDAVKAYLDVRAKDASKELYIQLKKAVDPIFDEMVDGSALSTLDKNGNVLPDSAPDSDRATLGDKWSVSLGIARKLGTKTGAVREYFDGGLSPETASAVSKALFRMNAGIDSLGLSSSGQQASFTPAF